MGKKIKNNLGGFLIMNDWMNISNKWLELANDNYNTFVKSVVWGQERALDLTKTVIAHLETSQVQSKKLVEDFTNQAKITQSLFQDSIQEGVKTTNKSFNNVRFASDASVEQLDRKIQEINEKLVANAKKN
jgi:polyhydroxyalkanoate synthesis regulator phasin